MFVAQALTDCAPASSSTVSSGPAVNDGASFTPFTVIVTVAVAVRPVPSSIS